MIRDDNEVEVQFLRAAPWGTQTAVAMVSAVYLSGKEEYVKVRTGLTIATLRCLPRVLRCFRCHKIGHQYNKCTLISSWKESYRKCRAKGHTIANCGNEPCYAKCSDGSET
jgi:hypothetical protein